MFKIRKLITSTLAAATIGSAAVTTGGIGVAEASPPPSTAQLVATAKAVCAIEHCRPGHLIKGGTEVTWQVELTSTGHGNILLGTAANSAAALASLAEGIPEIHVYIVGEFVIQVFDLGTYNGSGLPYVRALEEVTHEKAPITVGSSQAIMGAGYSVTLLQVATGWTWNDPADNPAGTYPLYVVVKVTDTGSSTISDPALLDAALEGPNGTLYTVDAAASDYDEPMCPQNSNSNTATLFPGTSATSCVVFDYPKASHLLGGHLLWNGGGSVYKWVLP